jgi:dipeptidyl aminopeptidase/acylaminoacyl peptidase
MLRARPSGLLVPTSVLALALGACAETRAPAPASPASSAIPAVATGTQVSVEKVAGADAGRVTADPDRPPRRDRARLEELSKLVAPVIDAYNDGDPHLTRDGRRLVYRSNRDGLPQLYVADVGRPADPPRRLTFTTERVAQVQVLPDQSGVLYLSDRGADERFSFFRVSFDGRPPVELTPGEQLFRDAPKFPRQAPGLMVYGAVSREEKKTRVYRHGYAQPIGAPAPVYVHPEPAELADVSPDGHQVLLIRLISLSESELVLVDLAPAGLAEKVRVIYPPPGRKALVTDARFNINGSRVLMATDGGGEQALVLSLDPRTGRAARRYVEKNPSTARIDKIVVSPKGDLVALSIDAGNRHEVRLLDANLLRPTVPVKLPLGGGQVSEFSHDGRRLLVAWSAANLPGTIHAVDTRRGLAQAVRQEPRPSLNYLPRLEASIVQVPSFDGLKVPVNVYLPAGAAAPAAGKRLPVLVSVHGGPAASSHVTFSPLVTFFASIGYAVVEPNIRGSTGFGRAYEKADDGPKRLDALRDLEAVNRWAARQSWADPKRMVVFGGSYGGYMVLMAVTRQKDLWAAGVDLVGPSSWRSFMASTTGVIREVLSKEFGSVEKDGEFLDSISPLRDVDKIVAPLFVYQGQNDPRVPRPESDQIVEKLRGRQVAVEYMVARNEGHSLDRRETRLEALSRIALFLERNLGGAASAAR